ncbi:MAG: hypothetical protein JWQ76_958 [Ramlibacter sp.]|nr:hypothetical protein [Ramlibacter sp.]
MRGRLFVRQCKLSPAPQVAHAMSIEIRAPGLPNPADRDGKGTVATPATADEAIPFGGQA